MTNCEKSFFAATIRWNSPLLWTSSSQLSTGDCFQICRLVPQISVSIKPMSHNVLEVRVPQSNHTSREPVMLNFGTLLDTYNTRLHAKIQKASLPISIFLQRSENLEKSKFSDFIKEMRVQS